jgi:hypothetical protein
MIFKDQLETYLSNESQSLHRSDFTDKLKRSKN